MKNITFWICFIFIISSGKTFAERAMYVDDFSNTLGDITAENNLLSYAQSHEIKTLLLYDLHIVHNTHNLTNPSSNGILADFIYKAKTVYGILEIGATAENGNYFNNVIDVYNNSRTEPLEKFDIYNLEFEFWISNSTDPGGYYCTNYLIPNSLPCTNEGAFDFFLSSLKTMRNLASSNTHNIKTEAYVGWPTAVQLDSIGDNLDNLRLHAYVTDANNAFGYAQNRLIDLATAHPNMDVSIIYSSEAVFMQNWLTTNSMETAEDVFTVDWTTASSSWSDNINLEGFTYFTYTDMLNVPLPVELIYFNGISQNESILLNWETATEINSDYFEIEKQDDFGNFNTLIQIKATGNSTSELEYQYTDGIPKEGINYYRLKQVDLNGDYSYSETIAIHHDTNKRSSNIYPSLVEDIIFIQSEKGNLFISIHDTSGKEIKTMNIIQEENTSSIHVSNLNQGMYILTINNGNKTEVFKFMKE